jgi:hypothetical protein
MRCAICRLRGNDVELGKPGTVEVTRGLVQVCDSWVCASCVRTANHRFARAAWAVVQAESEHRGPDESGKFRIDGAEEELEPERKPGA